VVALQIESPRVTHVLAPSILQPQEPQCAKKETKALQGQIVFPMPIMVAVVTDPIDLSCDLTTIV
jgi:hypothetical protein